MFVDFSVCFYPVLSKETKEGDSTAAEQKQDNRDVLVETGFQELER